MDSATTYYQTKLSTDIKYLKGVGPQRGNALIKNGIENIGDLLHYYPRKYLDRTNIQTIRNTKIGDEAVIIGKIISLGVKSARRRKFFQVTISDNTGYVSCIWFNSISWIIDKFQKGNSIAIFGKLEFRKGFQMVHPDFDILEDGEDPVNTGKILPQYSSNSDLKAVGLEGKGFRKIIKSALEVVSHQIEDYFNSSLLTKEGLVSLHKALEQIHFPDDIDELNKAIYRLKYDEHFFLQLLMALKKQSRESNIGKVFPKRGKYEKDIFNSLDFQLTNAQINVLKEIRTDLAESIPMNRLIQGDVGSGKTIVAVLAAAIVLSHGNQVAIMAPTEILAEQHYLSFLKFFKPTDVKISLLVGNIKKADKKEVYDKLKTGEIQLIVGTHALIQEDVHFKDLGMIIIDEQHRFGVEQRKLLIDKGTFPEILALTATPIPRTLAFTIHGDMNISLIEELPQNRLPVITKIVQPEQMPRIYEFIKKEVNKGHQCFIIYPLIEESETLDLKAADTEYKNLNENIFKEFNVGYIHGKMKKEDKDHQMQLMLNNEIQCLVSTTVIEVGIDIPNATVIIIENSERFGLTQLHQLRGRIGRGSEQSYCILSTQSNNPESLNRLKIMESTNNGFIISDEDLKLRGPGDFFGTKQHGYFKSKLANFIDDGPIINQARSNAFSIVKLDSMLELKKHKKINIQFRENYQHMLEFVNIS